MELWNECMLMELMEIITNKKLNFIQNITLFHLQTVQLKVQ